MRSRNRLQTPSTLAALQECNSASYCPSHSLVSPAFPAKDPILLDFLLPTTTFQTIICALHFPPWSNTPTIPPGAI